MKDTSRQIILDVESSREQLYKSIAILGLVVASGSIPFAYLQAMVACAVIVGVGLLVFLTGVMGMLLIDERYLLDSERRELLFLKSTRGKPGSLTSETVCPFEAIVGVSLATGTIYHNKRRYPAYGLDLECKDGRTISVLSLKRDALSRCLATKRDIQKMLGHPL